MFPAERGVRVCRGLTLLEVMITVVILGILVALAVPQMGRVQERTRRRGAVSVLQQIRSAQKQYRLREGEYYQSSVLSEINENLQLDLPSESEFGFSYQIAGDATTFTATLTRTGASAPWNGQTVSMDQDGTLGGNFDP